MIQIDIPMPMTCSQCPCMSISAYDKPFCNVRGMAMKDIRKVGLIARHPDCPLKEVEQ